MKKHGMIGLLAASSLAMAGAWAQVDLTDEANQISYSIGVNIAQNLTDQGLTAEIDVTAFIEGLRDSLNDNVQMSEDDMMMSLMAFQQRLMDQQREESEAARVAGQTFLSENAGRDGVTTTDSGLQYEVLERGEGGPSPAATDVVVAHYEGRFIDGQVFDSSIARGQPAEFMLNQVIPGWTEGLQLMQTGDTYRLYIPSSLAYGPGGSGPIPPHATLIFDVELIEVNPD